MENKKEITFGKYRIETFEEERNGKLFYFAKKYRATPKGRYLKEKCEFYYRYGTEAERDAGVQREIDSFAKQQQAKENVKAIRESARNNAVNPFKVGDIVYDSWGYDQTNIDFYQIVEVGKFSVKMRRIKSRIVEDNWNTHMSNSVAPAKDNFCGEPITKILQVMRNGEIYINSRHGWISKWDREKITESHYA